MAQSLRRKKIMGMVYGLGGAIVIIGALFKLLHFSIGFLTGGVMLTIGLLTEATIFVISAFDPVFPDLIWTNVYPELVEDEPTDKRKKEGVDKQMGLTEQLDQAFAVSELDVEVVNSLSKGIKSFKTTVENIGTQASLVNATEDYNRQITNAAQKLENLNELYEMQLARVEEQNEVNKVMMESTNENIGAQASLVNATEGYNRQITSAAQKLENLNELYEMQLARVEEQNEVNKVMMESTKLLQDQMLLMSQNINTLNTVYEGMLQAMKPKQ